MPEPSNSFPATSPPADWSESWLIDDTIRVQTAEEQVFCAKHRITNTLAWWHRISTEVIRHRSDRPLHLPETSCDRDADFAPVLASGWVRSHWCYITGLGAGERLEEWQPRRQSSSATSIRMQLMLQAIQLADKILAKPDWPRQMQSQLVTVQPSGNEDEPYRLISHCWLPSSTSSLVWEESVMKETARTLDLITSGMPWPLELTRAFHDSERPARLRLQHCETILLDQWQRNSQPARPIPIPMPSALPTPQPTRSLPSRVALAALVLVAFYIIYRQWPQANIASNDANVSKSTVEKTRESDSPSTPPAITITMPPLAVNPDDVVLIRQQLANAKLTGKSSAILHAARRLLQLVPEDADTRQLVTTLLHQETRKLIDFSPRAPLDSTEDWAAWDALGFPDARMLRALQTWPTTTAAAMEDLQRLAEGGSTTAIVLLGQLAAHNRADPLDYTKALSYFTQAAEMGDSAGAYLAGECYVLGKGVLRTPEKGLPYLERAAAAGDHRALDLLGRCYHKGWGVPVDHDRAVALLLKAIGMGSLHALANLAALYLNGEGVPMDKERGITLLQEGARQHDAACLWLLGQCAETGNGVVIDLATARHCYESAAALGHLQAKGWLEKHPAPSK